MRDNQKKESGVMEHHDNGKQAEERLREYERVVEGLEDMIAVVDRDYRYLIANPAFLNHRGMRRDQVIGHYVSEVLDQEIFEKIVKQKLDECFQGRVVKYELRYTYPKLGERDLLLSYFPIEGPGGVERAACILQDITEHKQAEEALRQAEQKYRDIFENAGEGIFQTTPEGRYIAANPALARMHGFDSPEELISSLRDISRQVYVDPARREEFKSLLEEHGVVRGFEHQLFRKDGSKIWVSVNARAVRDARAAILYYEGTTQDINERKRAEARSGAFVALARKLSGALTPLDAGRIIAQSAGDLLGLDSCDLNLYDADRDLVHPMLNIDTIDGRQTEVTGVISERKPTARSRRVIDHGPELLLREEPVQFDDDAIPFGDKSRPSASIATVPIQHATRVIGLLSIQSYTTHCYDTAALDDLQALADHCGEALNRIRAEEALREREARLSAIYSAAPVGIGVDVNRVIQEVNDTMCSITGYSREEFIGQNSRFLFLTQKDYESVGREKYRGIAEHLPKSIMARLKRKDGRIIEVLLSAVPLDAADLSQGVTFTVLDITERKRAEESLQKSESLLRATGKMARVGGWEFDVATLKQVWTEAVYEIHEVGLDYEPNVSKGVDFYAPEAKPIIAQAVQRAIDYGEPFDLELPFITAQGNRRWIHAIGQAQQSAGKTTKVFGTFQDITERKRAEGALRESEERYRDLVENSQEFICTHDLDGLILSGNRAAVEVMGYDPKDYYKRNLRELLVPEVRDQFDDYLTRIRRDGVASGLMLVQTSSGERRVWEYHNTVRTEGVAAPIVRSMARDITERRRAEKAMSDLRRELELTMNSMEEGVHRVDLKGNIVFENPAAARMLGWEVAELLGKHSHSTMHHTRQDGTPYPTEECPIDATFRDGVSRQVADEVFWRQDGTSFPVEYMTAPMRNDRNEIVATVVTFRDITERKRAEAALRESEQEQRLFNLATNDMFWKWDFATDRVARSIGFERAFGYSEHEITPLIGWWEERLHPDDQERVLTAFQTALKRGDKTCSYEYHFRRHDGSYATISDRAYFVRDESGKAVRAMGAMTDITERKRAEKSLRESEERYRELFENAKDPIYVHDLSGRYTSVNHAAEQLSGFTREEILGKHFSNFVSPRDLKHVRINLCRKLDEESETIYEVDLVTRSGQRVPVEVSSRLIYESGVAVGIQGTARDITDRKRAQEALRIYSQRLIQVQEAERENIARELHDEIGQVLTAVKINLQSVQHTCQTADCVPRLDESIGIVDEALGRVRELSIELRPSLLDDLGLTAALRWYVDRYAQRTGIIAEVLNSSKEDGRLPRELETACFRIAQEALTNVARHARAGSVSVQLERSRERMLLTVMDDGVGFDIDKLRKSASAASALGLRGMEERALAVGGYIKIDSRSGRGTRVCATFPLKRK